MAQVIKKFDSPHGLNRIFLIVALFWTILIVALATLNYRQFYNNAIMIVKASARDAYNKDLVYRRWATLHGGVYVPVTGYTPPNPYLQNITERDIQTPSGKGLTLVNPAYMTRQVHELGLQQYGLQGHITSLKPIRPENSADDWETKALKAFEQGASEMASRAIMKGIEYYRFMKPMMTEKGCLKCHSFQGYQVGDIRGGISVSIPWEPIQKQLSAHILFVFLTYGSIWLIVFAGVGFMMWKIREDIKQQIRFGKIIRESELKYRSLFDHMNQGMALHQIITDNDGNAINYRFLDANQSFEKITGLRRDDFIGKTVLEVLPGTESYWIEKYGHVIKTGEPLFYENYSADLNKFFEVVAYRVQADCFAVIAIDVTNRRKDEEEIKNKNLELTKLNATKDKLFSIIAHDLRSPFNSILGFSEMLVEQAGKKDYSNVGKYSAVILQASQRAVDLLMNLMDWARMQTGRIDFKPEYVDFENCLNHTLELYEDVAQRKEIKVNKILPSAAEVFADQAMLKVVLRNLISNAIKFTGQQGNLTISLSEEEEHFVISVKDTGIGIPPEAMKKLFRIDENFTTPGTSNEKGTGLGLILCREFVEKHGGMIQVVSDLGKGSTFSFSLPKKQHETLPDN